MEMLRLIIKTLLYDWLNALDELLDQLNHLRSCWLWSGRPAGIVVDRWVWLPAD